MATCAPRAGTNCVTVPYQCHPYIRCWRALWLVARMSRAPLQDLGEQCTATWIMIVTGNPLGVQCALTDTAAEHFSAPKLPHVPRLG